MKAEENNHLCRLSFRKTSSEFKCSVREGCNFSDKVSQNQACLRHLNLCWHKLRQTLKSLLGILAKWLYSKHCQTVSYYTIVYLLDKYLFYLTTVVSKQKKHFWCISETKLWQWEVVTDGSTRGASQRQCCTLILFVRVGAGLPMRLPFWNFAGLGCVVSF